MSSVDLPSDAPTPRLCHIIKWPDFDGYGFNLHAEKSKAGQYIGKVDEDSPAEYAGLREGDRIIEVNGVNIANENHRQVVERIKSVPNETKLLVVDSATDKWYKERKIVVKSTQPNVVYTKTPFPHPRLSPATEPRVNGTATRTNPPVNGSVPAASGSPSLTSNDHPSQRWSSQLASTKSQGSAATTETLHKEQSVSEGSHIIPDDGKMNPMETEESPFNGVLPDDKMKDQHNVKDGSPQSSASRGTPKSDSHRPPSSAASGSIPGSPASIKSSASSHSSALVMAGDGSGNNEASTGELNLNMSVSEFRQMLMAQKKPDPKKTPMDLRLKYTIVQQM